ncbi:NADH-quinone oxidoreductase subunit E [Buchnera aphidicola (Cinara kochiana kochiana)]|uniref:NADH-quinone oxidoreductase subunit E n=1 Tax=Buchnera aphidicola (Cinara kochiana kochiana) TaxID=2518976 RepID=A0A451D5I1_9GAMM|nr:NADH-quinone oxidoreductase subunit NuoE [Buchnera aphidicola]VFP81025.1 NADH-quinone oxidoreductase subunit E [Buchnera aphidicola (Cinara kochiana kochiana)]
MFRLSSLEISEILLKKKCYRDSRAVCIDALKIVQKHRKWVCSNSIIAISELLSIPVCEVESVATFYCHIFRKPVGFHVIRYCDSVVCFINGYRKIENQLISTLNIQPGETTSNNQFTLLPTCCLGACDKGPVMLVDENLYTNLTSTKVLELLDKYK